jgi:hypothetical protein
MFAKPMQAAVLLAFALAAVTPSLAETAPPFRAPSAERATTLMAWHRGHRHGHRHRRIRHRYGHAYGYDVPLWAWCYRYIGRDRHHHKICSESPYAWPY